MLRPLPSHLMTYARAGWIVGLVAALAVGFGAWHTWGKSHPAEPGPDAAREAVAEAPKPAAKGPHDRVVRISAEQQKLIGVEVQPVKLEPETILVRVPGRIAPDENRFAFITPRAPGIVRSVAVRIGQDVKAGEVLATIESASVGQARLDLLMNLQSLDVALAQARWQETILKNTLELVVRLRAEDTPEEINAKFADKPVGTNRERLMTAYTAHRLAKANLARKNDLYDQEIIRGQLMEESKARFDADLAAYQTLLDQMGYESNLANVRAQQALRQAETSVLVSREKLQVLGVDPDDDDYIPKTLKQQNITAEVPASRSKIPGEKSAVTDVAEAMSVGTKAAAPSDPKPLPAEPASLYKLKAPFAGTILDRELVVPGVAVDVTHRIFTLANLDQVWVEANINPGNLPYIQDDENVSISFMSDAYPEKQFKARLLYTGDLVVEKTQTVTLLARAENPDRFLKPGMYIDVALSVRSQEQVPSVPSDALLSDDERWIAFVRTGPESFELREVKTRGPGEERTAVFSGLRPGEDVVTRGAFKLKAEWIRMASTES
ncbi:efflux RND transporter periplasmic adaptor subunit [Paludisphaera mucosa]|uniref:Efflux RND transporter periplasmic adaptor subunit n=1 Tax=Paludisphaera mucosa TaxID=3030827 RepID=A0ABT6FGI1_9BACT|nr:efflux RND transporter periplasmic adaptor subunit [Paludisphaera mucosa]MDG3006678.1 efflux RND transporter periplasmic adaptor subunit [Paludisphaera mucosa]